MLSPTLLPLSLWAQPQLTALAHGQAGLGGILLLGLGRALLGGQVNVSHDTNPWYRIKARQKKIIKEWRGYL